MAEIRMEVAWIRRWRLTMCQIGTSEENVWVLFIEPKHLMSSHVD